MKVCAISDFHGLYMDDIEIPSCDVLCIAGDFVYLETQRDLDKSNKWIKDTFIPWVKKLDCEKVIVTPGNHDFIVESHYENDWLNFKKEMYSLSDEKLIFLIDEQYTYKDITFYGCPYIKPISFGVWAFQKLNGYNIPDNIDVLITHDNPFYNSNVVSNAKYHLFGHWHDGISDVKANRYNCAVLNNYYSIKDGIKVVTIDIPNIEKTKVSEDIDNSIPLDTSLNINVVSSTNLCADEENGN